MKSDKKKRDNLRSKNGQEIRKRLREGKDSLIVWVYCRSGWKLNCRARKSEARFHFHFMSVRLTTGDDSLGTFIYIIAHLRVGNHLLRRLMSASLPATDRNEIPPRIFQHANVFRTCQGDVGFEMAFLGKKKKITSC